MKKQLLSVALATISVTNVATANKLVTIEQGSAPLMVEKTSFDGFNLGLSGAYINSSNSYNLNALGQTATQNVRGYNSAGLGLTAGYGRTLADSNLYAGIVYDFVFIGRSENKINNNSSDEAYIHSFSPIIGYQIDVNDGDAVMPYVKAGYSISNFKNGTDSDQYLGNGNGFNVGGGIAYALARHIAVFAEYNYIRTYGANKSIYANSSFGTVNVNTSSIINEFHVVKAGVSLRFNLV